jgi:hypothetical protein
MIGMLKRIEALLQSAIEGSTVIARGEVEPLDIVRQIERDIERHKRVFINDQVFVPHRFVINLYAPTAEKLEEYEALFHNADFHQYLEGFIRERGYRLLGPIRVAVRCHQERIPQFGTKQCFVEFSWPQSGADPGEVTVVLDPSDPGRISATETAAPEVNGSASFEVTLGKAYRSHVPVTRREFNIGRTEQVLQHRTGAVLRVNHLAFERPVPGDVINHSVSRQHAKLHYRDGAFVLCDSGSQNGTAVVRGATTILLPPRTPLSEGVALADGDIVRVGRAEARFRLVAIAARADDARSAAPSPPDAGPTSVAAGEPLAGPPVGDPTPEAPRGPAWPGPQ